MIMNVKLQLCSIQQVYGISVVQHAVNTLRSIGYSGSFNGISVNNHVTDAVLTCMLNLHTCMHWNTYIPASWWCSLRRARHHTYYIGFLRRYRLHDWWRMCVIDSFWVFYGANERHFRPTLCVSVTHSRGWRYIWSIWRVWAPNACNACYLDACWRLKGCKRDRNCWKRVVKFSFWY